MYSKLVNFVKFLMSGLFVDIWAVLLFSVYAIPGIYRFSRGTSLMPFFTVYVGFTCIIWFIRFMFAHTKDNFNYKYELKLLPILFIVSFMFCGYILNYQYSGQPVYRYALPVYCLTLMAICSRLGRKIYSIKINKAMQEDNA